MWKKHPDLWQETTQRRAHHATGSSASSWSSSSRGSSATPAKGLKYLKIYDVDEAHATRRQINSFSGLSLVAMVFNFIDILAHGRSESEILQELAPDEAAFRSVMKAWFTHIAALRDPTGALEPGLRRP